MLAGQEFLQREPEWDGEDAMRRLGRRLQERLGALQAEHDGLIERALALRGAINELEGWQRTLTA